jgi:hypothetical protein
MTAILTKAQKTKIRQVESIEEACLLFNIYTQTETDFMRSKEKQSGLLRAKRLKYRKV